MKQDIDAIQYTSTNYSYYHAFWQRQLAKINEKCRFSGAGSTSRSGSNIQTKVTTERYSVDSLFQNHLKKVGAGNPLNEFAIFYSAFVFLLQKYYGPTPLIATPKLTTTPEPLVLLVPDIEKTPTVKDLVVSSKKTIGETFKYQDLPLELVEGSLFNIETITNIGLAYHALTPIFEIHTGIEFLGEFICTNGQLEFRITYSNELFDSEFVTCFIQCLDEVLLEFTDLSKAISEVAYLPNKSDLIIKGQKKTFEVEHPDIPTLFQKNLDQYAENTAIIYKENRLTFLQLEQYANQLAHHLQNSFGITAGGVVGVMMNKSEKVIIAILAILKTGGIYLPIDPSNPHDRKRFILEDAKADLLITDSDFLLDIAFYNGKLFAIDAQFDELSTNKTSPPLVPIKSTDLAYIIYTSGSTGTPKGVAISHEGNINMALDQIEQFGLSADDRILQFASLSFDASIYEISLSLYSGAALVLIDPSTMHSKIDFVSCLKDHEVSMVTLPPSYLSALDIDQLDFLRIIVTAGEAANVKDAMKCIEFASYYNAYGPTECSVCASVYKVSSGHLNNRSIPIGKPISNTAICILNNKSELLPIGAIGEICISGKGLSPGYLNQNELTNATFVDHPLVNGEKMYRTGDLGRLLSSGDIEFIGRKDSQIKLRGYRIELGEIENAFNKIDGVADCTAQLLNIDNQIAGLGVYYVSKTEQSSEGLRRELQKTLPKYMVPEFLIRLDEVPLTLNGKVDRKALPLPPQLTANKNNYVGPSNEREQELLSIYESILKKEGLGVLDDFFALGGDSIKAIQIVAKINGRLATHLSVTDIFNNPSVLSLSNFITATPKGDIPSTDITLPIREKLENTKNEILADNSFSGYIPDSLEDIYPMSDIQKGMVYLYARFRGTGMYHDQTVNQFKDHDFDFDCFVDTFALLVTKHEILRTSFHLGEFDGPMQILHKAASITPDIVLEDISTMSRESQRVFIENYLQQDRDNYFVPEESKLWRIRVFALGDEYAILWSFHHAIIDGWSDALLHTEFTNIYNELKKDRGFRVKNLRASQKDFIVSQLYHQQLQEAHTYWKNSLDGFTRTDLPWHKLPKTTIDVGVDSYFGSFDAEFNSKLSSFLTANKISTQEFMLSAFCLLVRLLVGKNDITIGLVTNNRIDQEDGDRMIGCFLNTLPFRCRANQLSPKEYIHQISKSYRDFKKYDKLSLNQISQYTNEGNIKGNPLFDIAFNYTEFHVYEEMNQNIQLKDPLAEGFAMENTLLNIEVSKLGDELSYLLVCHRGIYEQNELEMMANYFNVIIIFLITDKATPFTLSDLIPDQEKNKLLIDFNKNSKPFSSGQTFSQIFEGQVKQTPKLVAVNHKQRSLTYADLNAFANRLAHALSHCHEAPLQIIPVICDRSIDLLASILGIFKSRNVYLPLEADTPINRLRFILEETNAKCIIVSDETFPLIAEIIKESLIGGIICLTDIDIIKSFDSLVNKEGDIVEILRLPDLQQFSPSNLSLNYSDTDLSYIIYTSGSTGTPKGAMIEHRGMMNHLYAKVNDLQISADSIVAQNASQCFDISIWQYLSPLLTGGKTIVYPNELILEVATFANQIQEDRVSILEVVPSYLNVILDFQKTTTQHFLKNLDYLVVTGETLRPELVKKWFGIYPSVKLVNAYGPTEASDDITHFIMSDAPEESPIPVGYPVQNLSIYILDGAMKLCPIRVKGEIFVAGVGVGRGYYNDEIRTNEVFMQNPFRPSEKMYKTGDIGRYLASGAIQFFGREDQQIKLRGHRIELGEIEHALTQLPEVEEAIVLAKESAENEMYLCAYIVTQAPDVRERDLSSKLKNQLPGYMVPSVLILLDKFPLTSNGKIDRNNLPNPDNNATEDTSIRPFKADTIQEQALFDAWTSVLGRNQVGENENFFHVGGDSIKAIQIANRLSHAGYKLEVKDIFESPVLRQLVPHVVPLNSLADQSTTTGPVPLTAIQAKFFQLSKKNKQHYNQAVMLAAPTYIKVKFLEKILHNIQTHHDILRSTFKEHHANTIAPTIHGLDYPVWIEEHDLRGLENADAKLTKLANRLQESIELENGPLLKTALFHLNDGDRWLIVVHHLVIDGVSWRILLEDIETLYHQLYSNPTSRALLPSKTDSFKLWAEAMTSFANSSQFKPDQEYWREFCKRSGSIKNLEPDHISPYNLEKDTAQFYVQLDRQYTQCLLNEVNEAFNTEINDILLTALSLSFKKLFKLPKLLICLEGHGREPVIEGININRTVGWFTSEHPVLLSTLYDMPLSFHIKHVKENLRQVPNNGIGYGLYKYLSNSATEFDNIEPTVRFNYLGQFTDTRTDDNGIFRIASEDTGDVQSLENEREFMLDILGSIDEDKLSFSFYYNQNNFDRSTIGQLAREYQKQLETLITYCKERKTQERTPSDFTFKTCSIEQIEQLDKEFAAKLQDIYPLTSMQQGILFHTLFENKSSVYFQQIAYPVQANLSVQHIQKSLALLFSRHEALRTNVIYEEGSQPLQLVFSEKPIDFRYKDVRTTVPPADRQKWLNDFLEHDRSESFDLKHGVLIRLTMVQFDDTDYQLVWAYHHILMDGWCMGILQREFKQIYQSLIADRPIDMPPAKSFQKYIKWLELQDKGVSIDFWENYLREFTQHESLSQLARRNPAKEYINSRQEFVISHERSEKLIQIAAQHQVTVSTLMQSIWGILLCKYSGVRDTVFGTVVSGRPAELVGVEEMVGLFINTIPVRLNYTANTTFAELLEANQREFVEALSHQYLSLAEIQSLTPYKQHLLDHIVLFENFPLDEELQQANLSNTNDTEGSSSKQQTSVYEETNYDINVTFGASDSIYARFDYNAAKYSNETVSRVWSHFEQIVNQVTEDVTVQIDSIDIVPTKEKRQLNTMGFRQAGFDQNRSVHHYLELHAAKHPDHIAIRFSDREISYQRLNAEVNQLSHFLIDRMGVGREDLFAVVLDRSDIMMKSILAIWKVGGCYLPIEPNDPVERIQSVLKAANVKAVISNSAYRWIEMLNLPTIYEDQIGDKLKTYSTQNPSKTIDMNSSAYVIYTSGSTGTPKGAVVEHIGMMNHMWAKVGDLKLSYSSIIAQNASQCFDISVWQFFAATLVKGTTHIYSREAILQPELFLKTLKRDGTNILEVVPSYLSIMVRILKNNTALLTQLKYLIVTGEEVQAELINKWLEIYPQVPVVNAYGPTEASDDITHYVITKPVNHEASVPIGFPIQNMHIYIVNPSSYLCPIGIKGEIWVAGIGVGRGYINEPKRSYDSFMVDPFSKDKHVRLYKTGDIGRYLENGCIEFYGRKDNQVKIRGHRIELGEIENKLISINGITDAAVVTNDHLKQTTLKAFIISDIDVIDIVGIQDRLSELLPDYMIPSQFHQLEQLPLTSNGKVDRKALSNWKIAEDTTVFLKERDRSMPQNIIEERMIGIWQEILDHGPISIKDNYFDIGGNSLNLMQMWMRIKEVFGISVPITDLYITNTVEKQVKILLQKNKSETSQDFSYISKGLKFIIPHLTSEHTRDLYFLPPFGGIGLYYSKIAHALSKWYTLHLYNYRGIFDDAEPISNWNEVIGTYADDIIRVAPNELEKIIVGYSSGAVLAFEVAIVLQNQGYKSKLILVDGFPKEEGHNEDTLEVDSNDYFIHSYIGSLAHFKDIDSVDLLTRLKKTLKVFNSLWRNYFTRGTVHSPTVIFTDLDSQEIEAHKKWAIHFPNGCQVIPLEGEHEQLLIEDELMKKVVETIRKESVTK